MSLENEWSLVLGQYQENQDHFLIGSKSMYCGFLAHTALCTRVNLGKIYGNQAKLLSANSVAKRFCSERKTMAKVPTFRAKIVKGKIVLAAPAVYQAYLTHFPDQAVVDVIVKVPYKTKTNPQLGYYHACIKPAAQEGFEEKMGCSVTMKAADGALSRIFLTEDKGTELERVKSKADLSCKEMSIFVEQCIQMIAVEFGLVVPMAGEWNNSWKFEDEHQR